MSLKIQTVSGEIVELPQSAVFIPLPERLKRSVKSASLGLGLALLALPIPGVHMFLVPSFLLFAVVSGGKKAREIYRMDLTGVACPTCQKPLNEKEVFAIKKVLRMYCRECRNQFRIFVE